MLLSRVCHALFNSKDTSPTCDFTHMHARTHTDTQMLKMSESHFNLKVFSSIWWIQYIWINMVKEQVKQINTN